MKFTSAGLVSEAIWQMRLAEIIRGTNRSWINQLVNGDPPYSDTEVKENQINVNTNFLDATQLVADARRSYYNAFQSPGKFFTVTLDYGEPYERIHWGNAITQGLQRIMKGNRLYSECLDSQFASTALHGVGPAVWVDKQRWVPEEKSIEDVLIPGDTLRSLRNLDYFAVYYQYTPEQLYRLTHGPKVDPAWNMPMVEAALKWAHNQTSSNLSYSDLFAPEKVVERQKQDLGFYGTDTCPTIDFWKFFFYEDKKGECGWRMRGIIDTPANQGISKMPKKNKIDAANDEWLYNPGDRVYAFDIEQLIHFQMGDLSAVSPFKYHSIRSMGWLIYSICHLYNRLRSREIEATFEATKQLFRANQGDATRITKIDLIDKGIVPEGIAFVTAAERSQVPEALVDQSLRRMRENMEYAAAQYRQQRDIGSSGKEKTATEVMSEVNASMALVGSMLTQAYRYQFYQYREICRRFCIKNSSDPEVRQFRAYVLQKGVPEEALNHNLWSIEPERVLGNGNATLQMAIADSLLQMRALLDPESQRIVDRIAIAAKTSNDDLANRLVPEVKTPTKSAHDAAQSFATLMMGAPVPVLTGINHVDAIEMLFADMQAVIQRIQQMGGQTTQQELMGLQNVGQHISEHLNILAQDKNNQDKVRQYATMLTQIGNIVKGFAQRLAEQQQAAQQGNGNGGIDPKDLAKVQAMQMQAQVKAQNAAKSHAERTAQRQLQFEQQMKQKEQEHQAKLRQEMQNAQVETVREGLKTAAEIRAEGQKNLSEE